MAFNSILFLLFFLVFYFFYWLVFNHNLKRQNILLLIASYIFYAWTDWRIMSYLIVTSLLNYVLGIQIEKSTKESSKKIFFTIGIIEGIAGLWFFKYLNFFINSFKEAFNSIGLTVNLHTFNIIIPLGISFYTFKTISYLIDIKNEKIIATKDWIVFFNYISFFPTIISGPIDKSRNFIPQLEKKRVFEKLKISDGMSQFLWGFFKKVVIADNCIIYTNQIFDNFHNLPASSLIIGGVFYMFQLYADFSGYSDMAIGMAKMIGFNVSKNFDTPFFSQNIADYWRRWHISLSVWLTEYVFTPLNFTFRDYGKSGIILAILLNFLICGIWHGPNWTFIIFGLFHGCLFIPLILKGTMFNSTHTNGYKLIPTFKEVANILGTNFLLFFSFVIFRSLNVSDAFQYISRIFSWSIFTNPINKTGFNYEIFIFISFLLIIEWIQRGKEHVLQIKFENKSRKFAIIILYSIIIWSIILWGAFGNKEFIYSKF